MHVHYSLAQLYITWCEGEYTLRIGGLVLKAS